MCSSNSDTHTSYQTAHTHTHVGLMQTAAGTAAQIHHCSTSIHVLLCMAYTTAHVATRNQACIHLLGSHRLSCDAQAADFSAISPQPIQQCNSSVCVTQAHTMQPHEKPCNFGCNPPKAKPQCTAALSKVQPRLQLVGKPHITPDVQPTLNWCNIRCSSTLQQVWLLTQPQDFGAPQTAISLQHESGCQAGKDSSIAPL